MNRYKHKKDVLVKTSTVDADDNERGLEQGGVRFEVFDIFVFGVRHWSGFWVRRREVILSVMLLQNKIVVGT